MHSLAFLVLTGLKNRVLELKRKPGKMVLYLVIIVLLILAIVASLIGTRNVISDLPIYWVSGILFLFLLLFFLISIQKGLLSGDTIFEMNDVNLLFVSPLNPRSILFYGLIKLATMSFLSSIFILFQGSTLKNFGIEYGGIMIIFVVYILVMMIFSMLSLVIYSVTNGRKKRKNMVKLLTLLIFVPLIIYFVYEMLVSADLMTALGNVINSLVFQCTPLLGWSTAGIISLVQGSILAGFGWLSLTFISGILMFVYIMFSKSDYYEDVLVATETAFEKKRAAMDGDIQAATVSNKNVKVRGIGLAGTGASVFIYKHLRESFRQNRFGFFSWYTAIMAVIIIVVSLIFGAEIKLTIILQVLMWIQIFVIGTGRGLMELYNHYIYMISESSFSKIVFGNFEFVIKTLIESILFLLIPGIILGENILVIILSMLVFTLFTMLMIGINYLSIRWTNANIARGILAMIYFLAVIVIMLPGLVPALIVFFTVGGTTGTVLALLILSVWELIAAVISFALSRGVLDNCDMPSMNEFGK